MANLNENLESAKSFSVTIFADEYGQLELDARSTIKESQAIVRDSLGLNPLRRRAGKAGGSAALTRAFKGTSDEKRREILRVLQE